MFRCFNCGENAKFRCSECRTTHYCSEKCQGTDWGYHRINCIPYDMLQDTHLPESPCAWLSSLPDLPCEQKVLMDEDKNEALIDDCADESHNRIRSKKARHSLVQKERHKIHKEHLKKHEREKVPLQKFMKYCDWCGGTAVNCSFCNSTGLIPDYGKVLKDEGLY